MDSFKDTVKSTRSTFLGKIKCPIRSPMQIIREQRREFVNYIHQQDAIITYLDTIHNELENDKLSKQMSMNSIAACLESIHEHCIDFLREKRGASYEEWIREFHPESVCLSSGCLDHRFYVIDSDHRIIWNGYCDMHGYPERKVNYLHSSSR